MHVSGACFQDSVKIRNIVRIISCSGTNLKWMAECETLVNSKQVTVLCTCTMFQMTWFCPWE